MPHFFSDLLARLYAASWLIHDRDLLENLVARTGLSRAELIRRGLRRLAGDESGGSRVPGWSLDVLSGSIAGASTDLAARHDDYLAEDDG